METTDLSPIERARASLKDKQTAIAKHQEAVKKLQGEAEELMTVVRWLERMEKAEDGIAPRVTKASEGADFAVDFVSKHGPAKIGELYEAFLLSGPALTAATDSLRKNQISTYMIRDGRLRFYKEFGRWWFADKPYPIPEDEALKADLDALLGPTRAP